LDSSEDVTAYDSASVPDASGADASDGGQGAADSGEASADAANCTGNLSNIGTGDFEISLTVTTTATTRMAILGQRSTCDYGNFWDIRLETGGHLLVETDTAINNSEYTFLLSTVAVNDGTSHAVVVARRAGTLSVTVDGTAAGSASSTASLGTLAALRLGTDVCQGVDGTIGLSGSVTGVCVSHCSASGAR
jgi:hypothetical protein